MQSAEGEEKKSAINSGGEISTLVSTNLTSITPGVVVKNYQRLLWISFISAIVVIAIFASLFFFSSSKIGPVSILPVVILSGCMGAIFSSLTRLYGYRDLPVLLSHEALQGLSAWSVGLYAAIPILVGAIASAVLYMVLASELISGTLFPKFGCPDGQNCDALQGLVDHYGPKTSADFSKAIVWGVIAGFAERLVPDTIGSFVKAANSAAEAKGNT